MRTETPVMGARDVNNLCNFRTAHEKSGIIPARAHRECDPSDDNNAIETNISLTAADAGTIG